MSGGLGSRTTAPQPFLEDADFTLYNGDALEVLKTLPDESVHMVVTSPPYWGLRDYGTGAWSGGDPDCDHVNPSRNRTQNLDKLGERYSGGGHKASSEGAVVLTYKDVCGKCGASRVDNQLGLEPTPDAYLERMVAVFREVRRVLRSDGTCWVNMGDSYASDPKKGGSGTFNGRNGRGENYARGLKEREPRANPGDRSLRSPSRSRQGLSGNKTRRNQSALPVPVEGDASQGSHSDPARSLKPKDLCMIPARLALALQADGWWLRSQIVWSKPNPMPESVTDRPTTSHEFVYLLAKSPRYFFDQEAVREPWGNHGRDDMRTKGVRTGTAYLQQGPVASNSVKDTLDGLYECQRCGTVKTKTKESAAEGCGVCGDGVLVLISGEAPRGPDGRRQTKVEGREGSLQHRDGERWPNPTGRNLRSVWEIATQPYPEAHFATYPEELVRRCILAGTSEKGCCPECGAPWERETDVSYEKSPVHGGGSVIGRHEPSGQNNYDGAGMPRLSKVTETTGWAPTCTCGGEQGVIGQPGTVAYEPTSCTVLDPFMGSGTTALVARKHGRRTIGIELSREYCELASRRLQQLSLLAGSV